MTDAITVEVAFATPQQQVLEQLVVPVETIARQAVLLSGLVEQFPALMLDDVPLGIWGEHVVKPSRRVLRDGERVEVLRVLLCDPKVRRRIKAAPSGK